MDRQVDVKALVSHLVRGDGLHKCRICMGDTSEGQVFLGDTVMTDGERPVTLAELLENITGVEVESTPLLPDLICQNCAAKSYEAFLFKQLCLISQEQWNRFADHHKYIKDTDDTKDLYMIVSNDDISMFYNEKDVIKESIGKEIIKEKNILQLVSCPECNKKFDDRAKFNRHVRGLGLVKCNYCDHVSQVKDFIDHLVLHDVEAYCCGICNRVFEKKTKLARHFKWHTDAEWVCDICKKSFANETELADHRNNHDTYKCACKTSFKSPFCYNYHTKKCKSNQSVKDANFVCHLCSKTYTTQNGLRMHILSIHKATRPYQCEQCGKKFIVLSHLKEHYNTHNRILDKYTCVVCSNTFSTLRGYRVHYKNHHTDGPRVKRSVAKPLPEEKRRCGECKKVFAHKRGLDRHVKVVHGKVKKDNIIF